MLAQLGRSHIILGNISCPTSCLTNPHIMEIDMKSSCFSCQCSTKLGATDGPSVHSLFIVFMEMLTNPDFLFLSFRSPSATFRLSLCLLFKKLLHFKCKLAFLVIFPFLISLIFCMNFICINISYGSP